MYTSIKACSAAAKHFVQNEDAEKLGFKLLVVVPKAYSSNAVGRDFALCGFFVENDKTSWSPCVAASAN